MEKESNEASSSSGSDFISLSDNTKPIQDFKRYDNDFSGRNYRGGYRGRGNFYNPYEFNRPQHFYNNNQPQNFRRGQQRGPWSQPNRFRNQQPHFQERNKNYRPRFQPHSIQSDDISLYVHPSTFEDPWAEFMPKKDDAEFIPKQDDAEFMPKEGDPEFTPQPDDHRSEAETEPLDLQKIEND